MAHPDLKTSEVARIAGVHEHTVRKYADNGAIMSYRDNNNFRRYPLESAFQLKKIMATRTPSHTFMCSDNSTPEQPLTSPRAQQAAEILQELIAGEITKNYAYQQLRDIGFVPPKTGGCSK